MGPMDQMKNLDVNTAKWDIFMSVTLQAAVHLGKEYKENLRSTENQTKKSLRQLFQVTQKLITDRTEITRITTIDWRQLMWRGTILLTDKAVQFATAKTYVFSDSVPCLGGISTEPVKRWKVRCKWFLETRNFSRIGSDRRKTDGIREENLPGFTTWRILDEIQKMISEFKCEPEHLKGRIIFMSMSNDNAW